MLIGIFLAAVLSGQTPGGFTPVLPETCLAEVVAERTIEATDEPQCFVKWLYGPGVQAGLTPLGQDADRVFSRETAEAIRRAQTRTPRGEQHPALQADPLCQCQDPDDLILVLTYASASSETISSGIIRFTFYPLYDRPVEALRPEDVFENTLVLVKQVDGWRVHDVLRPEFGYSFLASLAE